MLLEFILSVIHPDKSTWVTITIGNTIFGALDGCRPVDWGLVFWDLIKRLVARAGKAKPTPICSFLFHLYHSQGLLTDEEEIDYMAPQELTNYRITPDLKSKSNPVSGGEETGIPEQPTQQPEEEILSQWHGRLKRLKKTYRASQGFPSVRLRGEGSRPQPIQSDTAELESPTLAESEEHEEEQRA